MKDDRINRIKSQEGLKGETFSMKDLNDLRKNRPIVVLQKCNEVVIVQGIRALAIIKKHKREPYEGLIWPKHQKRITDIVVFYNKKTLETGYRLGQDAVKFKKEFKFNSDCEIEFEYFRPITRRDEGL
jgi:hypothetical protein